MFSVLLNLRKDSVMCNICSIGVLTYRFLISSVRNLYPSSILRFVRVFGNVLE